LFSSDAFGQHYAGLERFDDQVGDAIMPHARTYYANILLPYSALVTKLVEKVTEMNLALDIICPDHGIIWRKDPARIINAYVEWAAQKPKKKAIVLLDAGAVLVGSPTLNNGLFPTVSDFLTYMKGLKPKNKIAAAFGSYGWSGESVKLITKELEAMKFEVIDPGLSIQWVPDAEAVASCFQLGRKVGQALSR
ncbi:MAG: FprA family A-type flavoprotein, partial [Deltaproteobacteria bacterium]|nr:FprA family A-type flavoprotein [Deltaproteobacteria bacterium]